MGAFCTNITLIGADPAAVEAHLVTIGRTAYLGTWGNSTVVYDEVGEAQDGSHAALAAELSDVLGCAAVASLNHDDDILYLQVFEQGRSLGELNSAPDYFDDDDDSSTAALDGADDPAAGPSPWALGLDPEMLVRTVGHGDPARLAAIADRDAVFASDLHLAIVTELGLPSAACGVGFTSLSRGELPADAEAGGLHLVTTPG